jgi:hypothetical protein
MCGQGAGYRDQRRSTGPHNQGRGWDTLFGQAASRTRTLGAVSIGGDDFSSDELSNALGQAFGGPDVMASLTRWAAEGQVDEAARARSRERWLQKQAEEETTFVSVLADLAERDRAVLVQMANGRRHRGTVAVLGIDFVGVRTDTGVDVFVALDAIASVRSGPNDSAALSGRTVALRLLLSDAIVAMAEDRPRVTVATAADGVVNGDLRSVGQDVVTIRVDGDTRANIYVPMHAISEIAIAID